jgi:hypothetical protein
MHARDFTQGSRHFCAFQQQKKKALFRLKMNAKQ